MHASKTALNAGIEVGSEKSRTTAVSTGNTVSRAKTAAEAASGNVRVGVGETMAQKKKLAVKKDVTKATVKTVATKKPTAKPQAAKSAAKPAPVKVAAKSDKAHAPSPVKAAAAKVATAPKKVQAAAPVAAPKLAVKPAAPVVSLKPVPSSAAKPVAAVATVAPSAPRPVPAAAATATAPKIVQKAAQPSAATPKDLAQKAAQAHQQLANKKPVNMRHGFKTTEWIVYPAHGVGRIVAIEEQEIAGMALELFVIQFDKDKLTLRVPTGKSQSVGMRKLAEEPVVRRAMDTLKGKARIKRTMWSRRAQEFEAKINSGDLVSIAEVVRDLFRADTQPEQSYSERQLYEAALDRMAREIAAVEKLDERGAVQRITEILSKSEKGRRATEVVAPVAEIADGSEEIQAA